MNKEEIKQFLNYTNYITINKIIAKKIGINATFLLSNLINAETYFNNLNINTEDKNNNEYFYLTQEKITEETTLTRHETDTAIKILKNKQLIETKIKGIPPIKHFKINYKNIEILLKNEFDENRQIKLTKSDKLNCRKPTNNNKNYNINTIIKKEDEEEKNTTKEIENINKQIKQDIKNLTLNIEKQKIKINNISQEIKNKETELINKKNELNIYDKSNLKIEINIKKDKIKQIKKEINQTNKKIEELKNIETKNIKYTEFYEIEKNKKTIAIIGINELTNKQKETLKNILTTRKNKNLITYIDNNLNGDYQNH